MSLINNYEPKAVSASELFLHPLYPKQKRVNIRAFQKVKDYRGPDLVIAIAEPDGADLMRILQDMGLDTTKNFEEEVANHINVFGQPVMCKRWVGSKRTDREWVEAERKGKFHTFK